MVTIISGTNRNESNTLKVAEEYKHFLSDQGIDSRVLSLKDYDVHIRNEAFIKMETELLKTAERFIFILPEYNGSYPGILKMMIDNSEVSKVWWHKKVLLTGVSSGRAGNLRGMEHLTGSLLHMKMLVHPNRMPISVIHSLMTEEGKFNDAATIAMIKTQLEEFLSF